MPWSISLESIYFAPTHWAKGNVLLYEFGIQVDFVFRGGPDITWSLNRVHSPYTLTGLKIGHPLSRTYSTFPLNRPCTECKTVPLYLENGLPAWRAGEAVQFLLGRLQATWDVDATSVTRTHLHLRIKSTNFSG